MVITHCWIITQTFCFTRAYLVQMRPSEWWHTCCHTWQGLCALDLMLSTTDTVQVLKVFSLVSIVGSCDC